MAIREVIQAFTATDASGHSHTVPKCAMLTSVGDSSGYNGRIDDIATVASFVYFGVVYYAPKTAVETKTKPIVITSRRHQNTISV